MTYELAKKLKEAGFKQGVRSVMSVMTEPEDIYFPTLSELIEACGVGFSGLVINPSGWRAWSREKTGRMAPWITDESGKVIEYAAEILAIDNCSTPEEAVSNLWLELNKK